MSSGSVLPREDTWWQVDQTAAIAAVRRGAVAMAHDLDFDDERVAEIGIIVTEMATNLVRHAGGGEVALRTIGAPADGLLRVLAIDSGPGSRNIKALISDGESTRGTLGIGLGACQRLSTAFDVYSVPGLGTIAEALIGRRTVAATTLPVVTLPTVVADLSRPLADAPCGDTTAHRITRGAHIVMVADGLGHGPLAAAASRRAAEILLASDNTSPTAMLERMHAGLGGTRGAAIMIARFDPSSGMLAHAGVGNIVARLVSPTGMRGLPSQPGIVGHRSPRLREFSTPVGDATALVMHSDGLSQRWSPQHVPGVEVQSPGVACAALMRAASSRRDDASVLVLRTAA